MKVRTFIVAMPLLVLALLGCEDKKLKEPIALAKLPDLAYPVVLPPTDAASSATRNTPPPNTPTQSKDTTVAKNRPRLKPKPPEKPSTTQPAAPSSNPGSAPPQNVAISPGPESGNEISAGLPHSVASDHRQSTAELIQLTEVNLKSLTRQLSQDEQHQVDQIKYFLDQSRSATADNDLVRAHNLALKAHLLSDELIGH